MWERRRIEIAGPGVRGSKQPFHAAMALPLEEAEALVARAIESSRALALTAISAAREALRSQGHEVVCCAVLLAGSVKPLPALGKILASHALIHTAEGELFRKVLLWAARECQLPVTGVPEKLFDASSLPRLASLGKLLGPPWTRDQKQATLAALMALSIHPPLAE